MAINISSNEGSAREKALWVSILFYFSLILFVAAVASYFVLDHFAANSSKALVSVKTEIAAAGTNEEKARQAELLEQQEKIKTFSKILDDHKFTSSFFGNFEEWCHPRVWFSRIDLNINDLTANLTGQTDNFQTLGQQMLVLKENDLVRTISLSNIQMGSTGRIDFNLSISFSDQVFSYNFEETE